MKYAWQGFVSFVTGAARGAVAVASLFAILLGIDAIAGKTHFGDIGLRDVVYDQIYVGGLSAAKGASAPDLGQLRDTIYLNGFDGVGTSEQLFFTINVPLNMRPGSDFLFHVHWAHNNAAPSGSVEWNIDYSYAETTGNAMFPAPSTISITQAAGAQYEHMVTGHAGMLVSNGFEPETQFLCRLWRDPTDGDDTFSDDAFLIAVEVHYQVDRIGATDHDGPWREYD